MTRLDGDGELLEALRQGEPGAAERLVTTYRDRPIRWGVTAATRLDEERRDSRKDRPVQRKETAGMGRIRKIEESS